MPPAATKSNNMAKISKSYILTSFHPKEHVMSVKCEEPIDELTVHVWLLYHHQNFKYCSLFVSGADGRTDRRTIRLLNAPSRPFRRGHKNSYYIHKPLNGISRSQGSNLFNATVDNISDICESLYYLVPMSLTTKVLSCTIFIRISLTKDFLEIYPLWS